MVSTFKKQQRTAQPTALQDKLIVMLDRRDSKVLLPQGLAFRCSTYHRTPYLSGNLRSTYSVGGRTGEVGPRPMVL